MFEALLPYLSGLASNAGLGMAGAAPLPQGPQYGPDLPPPVQPPAVSNPWEPVPIPQAKPPGMPDTPGYFGGNPANNPSLAPIGPGVTPTNPADKLMQTLRGVQVPKPPDPQKVTTPHAPVPRPIQGGEILALLESLNAAKNSGGLKLPGTLGQALGVR